MGRESAPASKWKTSAPAASVDLGPFFGFRFAGLELREGDEPVIVTTKGKPDLTGKAIGLSKLYLDNPRKPDSVAVGFSFHITNDALHQDKTHPGNIIVNSYEIDSITPPPRKSQS